MRKGLLKAMWRRSPCPALGLATLHTGRGCAASISNVTYTSCHTEQLFSGSCWSYPGDMIMMTIDSIHTTLGLPYWEAILVVTFTVRLTLIPFSILQQQQVARMAIMRPENDALREKYVDKPKFDENEALRVEYMDKMKALMAKHGCNPLRALSLSLLQFPIFLSFFTGLRRMPDYFPDFSTGGALWFYDLSAIDPTYSLPVLNALLFLMIVELGGNEHGAPPPQAAMMKNIFRLLAAVTVPATAHFSQGLLVYWSANNAFSMAQTLILKHHRIQTYFNILEVPLKIPPKSSQPIKKSSTIGESDRKQE